MSEGREPTGTGRSGDEPGMDADAAANAATTRAGHRRQPQRERPVTPKSIRRRRSVRQLLFVIAGAHTGAFIGSTVPSFGLSGDVASILLVVFLFALPFVVDTYWEQIEGAYLSLVGVVR